MDRNQTKHCVYVCVYVCVGDDGGRGEMPKFKLVIKHLFASQNPYYFKH